MGYSRTNIAAQSSAAVANRFVTSTAMKVGTYTLANSAAVHGAGFLVTVTHTTVATGTDTLGTITVVGINLAGQPATDTITPVADNTATGTVIFRSVTSVTGAGWVIAGGNDTLTVGHAAGAYAMGSSGDLFAIVINTTSASTITLEDAAGAIATLKASIAEGTYYFQCTVAGYLKVTHTSTSNYTLLHTGTMPTSIAV